MNLIPDVKDLKTYSFSSTTCTKAQKATIRKSQNQRKIYISNSKRLTSILDSISGKSTSI